MLGIEPQQRQSGKCGFERRATSADLAQQPTARCQMLAGLVQYAPDNVEPVGAACERQLRLSPAFARQVRHALLIDIGRVGNDQIVARLTDRLEQVATMQGYAVFKAIISNVAGGDVER